MMQNIKSNGKTSMLLMEAKTFGEKSELYREVEDKQTPLLINANYTL